MRRITLTVIAIVVVVVAVGFLCLTHLRISSLQDPGDFETSLATRAKHFLIERKSRAGIPPPPADERSSVEEGDKLFGAECAACHGLDGKSPTDAGRWMYPRAANLVSPQVQKYSDRDLFWIVRNGIRFSGMPAFGKVESDEHIWDIVRYLRTLRNGNSAVGTHP
ncbi:MAG: c-type cytochrome [Candidatus Acidiferrales bacterium]